VIFIGSLHRDCGRIKSRPGRGRQAYYVVAMRWIAAILTVMLALSGGPASAQQVQPITEGAGFPLPIDPSPPADTGKPRLFVPPPAPPAAGCAVAFDCRLKVIGEIRRNGAVELNASILKW
jgi:hypothetical protein